MKIKLNEDKLDKISKHVEVLNHELGNVLNDVKWIKKIMWYMAGVGSAAAGKIIFFQ